MSRLYLAGPMRGRADFNFPMFRKVAGELRSVGYEIFSPADRDLRDGFNPIGLAGTDAELADAGFDLGAAMAEDLAYICTEAEGVALLEPLDACLESKGTSAEIAVAIALGIPVKFYWEYL